MWKPFAACAVSLLGMAGTVSAQVTSQYAFSPFAGYSFGSAEAQLSTGRDGPWVGAQLEYGPSKTWSLAVGGDVSFVESGSVKRLYGGLLLRPFGRSPSGAPRPLYFELGGGYKGATSGNGGFVYGGAGVNLPFAPAAAPALIGRYLYEPSSTLGDQSWISIGLGLRLRL